MGVDIYTQKGVVLTIDEAAQKMIPAMKTAEIRKLISHIETAAADAITLLADKAFAADIQARLVGIRTTTALRAWFVDLVNAFVYAGAGEVEHADVLADILLTIMGPKRSAALPNFAFEYFASGRYSGWDVPTGTPCVTFDAEGLFEEKLTAAGRKLAKNLGVKSLSSATWTIYSV